MLTKDCLKTLLQHKMAGSKIVLGFSCKEKSQHKIR